MIDDEQFARERLLFQYDVAFQQGDAATIENILYLTQTDAILEQMILDWHAEQDEGEDDEDYTGYVVDDETGELRMPTAEEMTLQDAEEHGIETGN